MAEGEVSRRLAAVVAIDVAGYTGGDRRQPGDWCGNLPPRGQRGWAVCVNYTSSADEANGVVAEIEAAGGRAIAAQADVSAPEAVERMIDQVDAEFGPVTGLVNNAGVHGCGGRVSLSAHILVRGRMCRPLPA